MVWLLIPGFDDRVVQLEVGYLGAAALLCTLLYWLYRRSLVREQALRGAD